MKKKLEFLVIHCTATPAGREVSGADIRRWHTDPPPVGRGWTQVGSTRLYHINGGVEQLVPNNEDGYVDPWEITNGAEGHNAVCQHIVYAGGMDPSNTRPMDSRSLAQKESMRRDVLALHTRFPKVKIVGHNHFDSGKACPSFDVEGWLGTIGIKE